MKKIIRISTVPISLNVFCRGLLCDLSHDYEIVAVSSPGEDLDELAARENVRAIAVPMRRHIAPFHDLWALWQLFWLFRREQPDMVHSITPKAGLLAMIAAMLARVPVRLHTFTGLIWPTAKGLKRKILIAMDKLLCSCATHLNAEGEGVANDLQAQDITHKPLKILGKGNVRGIDFNYYHPSPEVNEATKGLREKFTLSSDTFLFLFVGRIVRDKGIAELLEAFKVVSESLGKNFNVSEKHSENLSKTSKNFASGVEGFSKIALLLVGNKESHLDPLPTATEQLIQTLPNVYLLPHHTDVRPMYAAAQALVFPSYREGFPNVVLEAGAFSLPSIVTDINGSREIITHGENGFIVPPHDSVALARAMMEMWTSPHRKTMGVAALHHVQEHFAQPLVWKNLKCYYQQLLS